MTPKLHDRFKRDKLDLIQSHNALHEWNNDVNHPEGQMNNLPEINLGSDEEIVLDYQVNNYEQNTEDEVKNNLRGSFF